jgi:DnaK suppressor protein
MSRKEEIEKLEKILLERRDALRKALAGDESALRDLQKHYGGDVVDLALDSANDEINYQLAAVESRELQQIEEALERIANGTYGICEITGKPIPLARLQALPYATTTIEAQRMIEEGLIGEDEGGDWSRVVDFGSDDSPTSLNDFFPMAD